MAAEHDDQAAPLKGEAGPSGLGFLLAKGLKNPDALLRKVIRIIETYRDWPFYWSSRLLGTPEKRVYWIRVGPRMWLRTGTVDFYIVDEVFRQNVYLPFSEWIRRDSVVVDVGAHIGAFSLLASKLAPSGRVVAVEPHPENFALLSENVRLNECKNVRALQLALAAHTKRRLLYISRYNVGGHSFYVRSSQSLEVDCIALGDLMARYQLPRIDMLKLDCEGAEHEILEDAAATGLLRRIARLSVEFHDFSLEHNGNTLVRLLEDAGFRTLVDRDRSMLHASRVPLAAGNA